MFYIPALMAISLVGKQKTLRKVKNGMYLSPTMYFPVTGDRKRIIQTCINRFFFSMIISCKLNNWSL